MRWDGATLSLIDQRLLPQRFEYVSCTTAEQTAAAIRDMVVRGAPAIGCAAAFGVAVEAKRAVDHFPPDDLRPALARAIDVLRASRPTAVNLFWALERMQRAIDAAPQASPSALAAHVEAEATAIFREDLATCLAIGRHGAELIPDGARVMTHCNAGALATAGHGTALGVIRSARDAGKGLTVIANETRPYLQGARLTAWEMVQEGIPVTLVTDNMVGHLMQSGRVDVVVVGADRIAANGDTANKIGTYTVAVLAASSTFDAALATGAEIPIEERPAAEVTGFREVQWAPEGVAVANMSFDVTPAELITGIITERGVVTQPYASGIAAVLRRA
jgi:methylthioribose-1-phosphate isomerase